MFEASQIQKGKGTTLFYVAHDKAEEEGGHFAVWKITKDYGAREYWAILLRIQYGDLGLTG